MRPENPGETQKQILRLQRSQPQDDVQAAQIATSG